MTVKQLMEQLSNLDPEMMVVISGHEGGVDEASYVDQVKIKLDRHSEWYYGDHEITNGALGSFDCEAVYIHRI